MSNYPTVRIPVPPHVRKFFWSEFGKNPIKLHQSSFIGQFVYPYLEKVPYRIDNVKPAHLSDCYIVLEYPKELKHRQITDEGRKQLGEVLKKYFLQQMYAFIRGCLAASRSEWEAVRLFRSHYNLDADHFDIDLMRKLWRDHRKSHEKRTETLVQLSNPDKPLYNAGAEAA